MGIYDPHQSWTSIPCHTMAGNWGGGTWGDLPAVPRTGRRRCSQYVPGHQVSSHVGLLLGIAPLTVSDRVFIFGFFHFGNPLGVRFFL